MRDIRRRAMQLRVRTLAYLRDNLSAVLVFLFIFIAGAACGITCIQVLYAEQSREFMLHLPDMLLMEHSFLQSMLLSVLLHAAAALSGLLAGLLTAAILLWPFMVFLRGFLLGAALYLGVSALPAWSAVVFLLLLYLQGAVLLPCMLVLYAAAGKDAALRIRSLIAGAYPARPGLSLRAAARPCIGLMLCALIEGGILPLTLRALGGAL